MNKVGPQWSLRTVPGVEHVRDEVVDEGDLGLGNAAGVPVEHGHDHRQTLALLLVRLAGNTQINLQFTFYSYNLHFTVTIYILQLQFTHYIFCLAEGL